MQTEVLRYIHTDYEVIVRTQDISYSWQRFKGRIKSTEHTAAPESYCRYTSKDDCQLHLYNPDTAEIMSLDASKVWDNLPPVVFETCKYQIRIIFQGVDKGSRPEMRHVRKDIEDSFFYDDDVQTSAIQSLTGEIDFLNEPGVFKLDFSYRKGGILHDCFVTFDVVSPKLDTKNDYKRLLAEVNREYENVIYRYLSVTLQQFSRGKNNNDATWMSAFQSVVDDYIKNLRRIIQNPHTLTVDTQTSRRAEQIKHFTPEMEEEYKEKESEGVLEEYYFRYNESHSTHDTMENRFVKYTLQHIGKRLSTIINTVLSSAQEQLSLRHRKMWEDYRDTLQKISKHQFFRQLGRYEGMSKESLVLQNRTGYQQIYKDWLKLKRGIDFYNGAANIGTLQIWEIYELWCFIKMKHLVAEIIGIDPNNPAHEQLITEPKGTLLNPFTDSSLEHIVEYHYPDRDDIITLHYQHVFNRKSGSDNYHFNTATTEQRPDIVLNIRRSSGEMVLTYLYDAKYRVINDKRIDKDFEQQDIDENIQLKGGDYPPTDSINQMHRYRDAIYYSREHEPYRNKEIIGGYILFPGRGDDESIFKRYYSQSIREVNIGAFPLLPNKDSLLRKHLEDILINYTSDEIHVAKARPQRSLAYVTEEEKYSIISNDLVMIAFVKSEEQRQWCFNNKWYNIPLDKIADTPWMKAKYLLLRTTRETAVGNLRKIVNTKHDVWTKEKLTQNDYPGNPSHSAYFMIRLHSLKETDEPLNNIYNVVNIPIKEYGTEGTPFMLVKLENLAIIQ